jgi:hypothetical protein
METGRIKDFRVYWVIEFFMRGATDMSLIKEYGKPFSE